LILIRLDTISTRRWRSRSCAPSLAGSNHLDAPLSMGRDLAGVITYDERMADGARVLGLEVKAPGRVGPS
jgi:hypothetical protein